MSVCRPRMRWTNHGDVDEGLECSLEHLKLDLAAKSDHGEFNAEAKLVAMFATEVVCLGRSIGPRVEADDLEFQD